MTVLRTEIRPGSYADSVVLMQLQAELRRRPGILDAGVVMGTAANLKLLRSGDLLPAAAAGAGAEDLVVVVRAESEAAARRALGEVDSLLRRRGGGGEEFRPRSLEAAIRLLPQARWALVSVPGRFAAGVARRALDLGLNVFLYSDNVTIDDEVELKRRAVAEGRLLLGPDCGTALIHGIGFGFANRVRRGGIGVISASGTGLQAVACRVHQQGAGISHGIGVGGRDLRERVGGLTARQALDLLRRDPSTEVVVLVSKPPAPRVAAELLQAALRLDKALVVYFSGRAAPAPRIADVHFARSLAEAADIAVSLSTPRPAPSRATDRSPPSPSDVAGTGPSHLVRGLFSGGTLAIEAAQGLACFLAPIRSNTTAVGVEPLPDASRSEGHAVIDLGADELTVGRLHPMLDPDLLVQRLRREAADPEVATILIDVVLGSGAHPDPAARLAPVIAECRQGRDLEIVVLLVGTDEDPQDLAATRERLTAGGASVCASVAEAVARVVQRSAPRGGATDVAEAPASLDSLQPPIAVLNVGLESFYEDLARRDVPAVQVDWRPPAGGDPRLMSILERMKA